MMVTGIVLMTSCSPTWACTSEGEKEPEGGKDPEAWVLAQKVTRFCTTTPGWMTCEFSPKLNYSRPLEHSPCYNYNLDYCYNMHCLDLCWAKICEVIESCKMQGKPDSCVTDVLSTPDYMTCEN